MHGRILNEHIDRLNQIVVLRPEIRSLATNLYIQTSNIRATQLQPVLEGMFAGVGVFFLTLMIGTRVMSHISARPIILAVVAGFVAMFSLTRLRYVTNYRSKENELVREYLLLSQQPHAAAAKEALREIGINPFDPAEETLE